MKISIPTPLRSHTGTAEWQVDAAVDYPYFVESLRQRVWIVSSMAALALLLAGSAGAEGRVYPTPQAIEPLAPGARVPVVEIKSVEGEPVDLAARVRENGALLVFYRGGW